MNELDEILSGDSNAVPEIQQEQPTNQQPRDDSGRFSSARQEQEAVAVEQPPVEQPAAEGAEDQPHKPGGIPEARLKAEADRRRAAEDDAAALRREIAELRGMVTATRQQPQKPQEEKQPASLWDDPDAFLQGQLSPVQQQMQETREMLWELQASQRHGADKVEAAKQAAQALGGTPQGRALHQQITSSGNPFDNLVQWHKQQETLTKVGADPEAWLNAEIAKRLADPAEQAKILEQIRNGASSSRSQPVTNLPRSISRLPAGGNLPADNDMSDGALFSHATR